MRLLLLSLLVSLGLGASVQTVTGQGASPEPNDTLAQNTVGRPATGEVSAAGAASVAPRPKTEVALACLLGMARAGCETVFVGASFNMPLNDNPLPLTKFGAGRLISYCAEEYVHKILDRCPAGPLETVQYLGTNVAGGDVYLAKFMHQENTYVISQPTPDGKIPALWRYSRSPNWVVRMKSIVELQAPVLPARTIYSRHE